MFPDKQTVSRWSEKSWDRYSEKADDLKVDSKEAASLGNLFWEVGCRQEPLRRSLCLLLLFRKSRITVRVLQAAFKSN